MLSEIFQKINKIEYDVGQKHKQCSQKRAKKPQNTYSRVVLKFEKV